MKLRFNLADKLQLNQESELHNVVIIESTFILLIFL